MLPGNGGTHPQGRQSPRIKNKKHVFCAEGGDPQREEELRAPNSNQGKSADVDRKMEDPRRKKACPCKEKESITSEKRMNWTRLIYFEKRESNRGKIEGSCLRKKAKLGRPRRRRDKYPIYSNKAENFGGEDTRTVEEKATFHSKGVTMYGSQATEEKSDVCKQWGRWSTPPGK